jgi:hypothetical protein
MKGSARKAPLPQPRYEASQRLPCGVVRVAGSGSFGPLAGLSPLVYGF